MISEAKTCKQNTRYFVNFNGWFPVKPLWHVGFKFLSQCKRRRKTLSRSITLLEQVEEFQFHKNLRHFYDPTHNNKNKDKNDRAIATV